MVNIRTYRLWEQLAVSDALPTEALPTVIEVLCTTSRAHFGVNHRGEDWRKQALAQALPALLGRTADPALRRRLLEQAEDKQLADLAETGLLTAADVPELVRTRRGSADLVVGLARNPEQVGAAITVLRHLSVGDVEYVVSGWDRRRYQRGAEPVPPMPRALFDAVLERALTPLAATLLSPEQYDGWAVPVDFHLGWSHQLGGGSAWRVLAACPQRWRELVDHPSLGAAVQHLLLDHAEAEARKVRLHASADTCLTREEGDSAEEPDPAPTLDDDLLGACLPALCLPELASLPKPSITARHRLHRIAERVRHNPRLATIAGEQLHTAADECVRRGRLLTPPRTAKGADKYRPVDLAEDLALLSATPAHLAKACALLACLEQPTVVATPPNPRWAHISAAADPDSPVRLLEQHFQHHRVRALVALAGNPHTPRTAVTDALQVLHPLELAWIGCQDHAPDWLRTAATALAPADEGDALLRLLTDDELDCHPDPAAVLQSWLDAPEADGTWSRSDVHRAVLDSRHHTLEHLRQLPADDVLTHDNGRLVLPILVARCGSAPERWQALLKALDYGYDDKITFGELLDSLQNHALA